MSFTLPELPYSKDALEPHMSRETLEYHYGKHHKKYVDTTNELIAGTEFENASLEEIIKKSSGKLFNNAAQVWNHNFFWSCLSPHSQDLPGKKLSDALTKDFGGVDNFTKKFSEMAAGNFGSGWTWLVRNADGHLEVVNTSNAGNPLTQGKTPLLTVDVWEHAYYVDYRNARPTYLEHFWLIVNWPFVERNLG